MSKLVEILDSFIEALEEDEYFAANELNEYAAESETEQAVVDALKKYERVFDDGANRAEILTEIIRDFERFVDEPRLGHVKVQLYCAVVQLYKLLPDNDNALLLAERFDAEGSDKKRSLYLLADINLAINTRESLLKAAGYADKLTEAGGNGTGVMMKTDALTALGDYESALAVVDKLLSASTYDSVALYKKYIIYLKMRRFDNAISLLSEFKSTDYFTACVERFKEQFDNDTLAVQIAKDYLVKKPGDNSVLAFLARLTRNIDNKIYYYELANKNHTYDAYLFWLYEKRGNPKDAGKYVKIAKRQLKSKSLGRGTVYSIIYGSFARFFGKGLMKEILNVLEQESPDYECGLTLIGRAYEFGLGVKKDHAKAFEYFTRAMNLKDAHCCGKLFHAYCLLYGIGVKQDKEQAKAETLEMLDERSEADRYCLYAMFALEGDSRFSREKAIELLKSKSEENAAANLLLYRLTKGTSDAEGYAVKFTEKFDECDYLEQQFLKKYIGNLDAEYIHVVTN